MLLREIPGMMFASPVMAVTSVVSVACAGILVVNISSNMSPSGDSSSQYNYSNQGNTTYENQFNVEQRGGIDLDYNKSPHTGAGAATGTATSKNHPKASSKTTRKGENSQYITENVEDVSADEYKEYTDVNNAPSIADFYSGFNSSNNAVNNSSTTTTTTTGTDVTSKPDDNSIDPQKPQEIVNTPPIVELEVKRSETDTHYVSCRPIEANGPPCMCTHTIENSDGVNSWIDDNCGS